MGVAHGRVCQQHTFLLQHPGGDGLGALNDGEREERNVPVSGITQQREISRSTPFFFPPFFLPALPQHPTLSWP